MARSGKQGHPEDVVRRCRCCHLCHWTWVPHLGRHVCPYGGPFNGYLMPDGRVLTREDLDSS